MFRCYLLIPNLTNMITSYLPILWEKYYLIPRNFIVFAICRMCMENVLPFKRIDDESTFLNVKSSRQYHTARLCLTMYYMDQSYSINLIAMRKIMTYLDTMAIWIQINITITNFSQFGRINCNHFVEDTFNKYLSSHHIPDNAISLLHLNIKSIPANFTSFLSYINNLNHDFSVIGLPETYLKQGNITAYGIDGYSHTDLTSSNGIGGGISLLNCWYLMNLGFVSWV